MKAKLMKNITFLLTLSVIIVLPLVGFSIQNYLHSKTLLYDYLTRKAITVSLLYEAKARNGIAKSFPAPPTEILQDKQIRYLTVFGRDKKPLYILGKNIFKNSSLEHVLKSQQLEAYLLVNNNEPLWVVSLPFHLGDLEEEKSSIEKHVPKFKILSVAIPLSVGESIILPAKIQLVLSIVLLIFFLVINYWQWQNFHHFIAMQNSLIEKERLATVGLAAARLAHEIRNPIAGIKGLAQLLEEETTTPQAHNYLKTIIAESDRLNTTVTKLLEYSKPKKPAYKELKISTLTEEIISLYCMEIKNKEIIINKNIPENTYLHADSDLIKELLHNLLSNAIQATNIGGNISIAAENSEIGLLLSICNTGEQITPELSDKIFEPFFSTKTKGTGLGLSICKQIVAAHNGKIFIENFADGTCFKVLFPKGDVVS